MNTKTETLTIKRIIGFNIATYRNSLNMSQIQFAAQYGISIITLARIETGKCALRLELIVRLCNIIECELCELFERYPNK